MPKTNFQQATDRLFARVTQNDLADALGVSTASIRQARLRPDAHAVRPPPPSWQGAVLMLAEAQARHYQKLAADLRGTADPRPR